MLSWTPHPLCCRPRPTTCRSRALRDLAKDYVLLAADYVKNLFEKNPKNGFKKITFKNKIFAEKADSISNAFYFAFPLTHIECGAAN